MSNRKIISAAGSSVGVVSAAPADPWWPNVSLYLNGDTLSDSSSNALTVTNNGSVTVNTTIKKYGTGSMSFNGTSQYLSLGSNGNFAFGTGDFTVEAWVYPTASGTNCVFQNRSGITDGAWFGLNGGKIFWYDSAIGLWYGDAIQLNTWQHVAWTRSGGVCSMFINGVIFASTKSTSGNYTYTTAMVGYDVANAGNYFAGYIDDLRITKGYARYTQNFTPPSRSFPTQYISTGYDPNYADVSLLLNGNGTNGSTTFTDLSSSPKTITTNGTVQINTSQKKYGTGSLYFDGSSGYLSIPDSTAFDFSSGTFTVECWVYQTSNSGTAIYSYVIDKRNQSATTVVGCFLSGGIPALTYGAYLEAKGTTAVTLNTWTHVAWVLNSGTLNTYINGVSTYSITGLTIPAVSGYPVWIGRPNTYNYYFAGYIDDLRITKGVARYTTNFTPPTYQLPTDTTGTVIDPLRASTSLLLRGNGTNGSTSFTDESPNGLTVTNSGSVTVNTTTKKYGTGSMAFSGSNSLAITSPSNLSFGTNDFSVEFWFYANSSTSYDTFFSTTLSYFGSNDLRVNTNGSARTIQLATNSSLLFAGNTAFNLNVWNHLAIVRYGTNLVLFLNGVNVGSVTNSTNFVSDTFLIGSVSSSYYFNGYIDDFRVTKGYARYTANFTPPTYEDPIVTGTVLDYNYPQVSLLLNGDGTNGSTTFTDLSSSPKTITNTGSIAVNTTTKKFGTGSMYFSGSSSTLSTVGGSPYNMGTSDMTLEAWVYPTSTAENTVFDTNWGTLGAYQFSVIGNGVLTFYYKPASGNINVSGGTVALNRWSHVACVRILNTVYLYVNGVQVNSASFTQAFLGGTTIYIGSQAGNYGFYSGYIDDLRITKGVARYTANFTPPTAPLPTSYS